jgi:hypothetical protein
MTQKRLAPPPGAADTPSWHPEWPARKRVRQPGWVTQGAFPPSMVGGREMRPGARDREVGAIGAKKCPA